MPVYRGGERRLVLPELVGHSLEWEPAGGAAARPPLELRPHLEGREQDWRKSAYLSAHLVLHLGPQAGSQRSGGSGPVQGGGGGVVGGMLFMVLFVVSMMCSMLSMGCCMVSMLCSMLPVASMVTALS